MNFKRLNERLQQFLEISDETVSDFMELRRANRKAADNRYNIAIDQGADSATLSKLHKERKEAAKKADRAEDAVGKRHERKQAQKKAEIDDVIAALANGSYNGDYAEAYNRLKNEMDAQDIHDMFNNYYYGDGKDTKNNSIFPSCWDAEKYGPYPKELAKGLSLSNKKENLSDVYNVYYAHHVLSDDAMEIFKDAALQNKDVIEYIESADAESVGLLLKCMEHNEDLFIEDLLYQIDEWDKKYDTNYLNDIHKVLDE